MLTSDTIQPVESTDQFARKLFYELQQAILGHESQAMNGNVEAIHDMRVGIRRLRVALSNFAVCLSKSDRHRLQTNLKNLADALGGVRDLDVMIEALKDSQKNQLKEDKIVIGALIRRLQRRRHRQLQRLTAYLDGEEYSAFRGEFSGCGEELDEQTA
ncbi:MAG: CHAD domain-containing protein [Blastocatellales bacterium]